MGISHVVDRLGFWFSLRMLAPARLSHWIAERTDIEFDSDPIVLGELSREDLLVGLETDTNGADAKSEVGHHRPAGLRLMCTENAFDLVSHLLEMGLCSPDSFE